MAIAQQVNAGLSQQMVVALVHTLTAKVCHLIIVLSLF